STSRTSSRWTTTSGYACSTAPAPAPATTPSCRYIAEPGRSRRTTTGTGPHPRAPPRPRAPAPLVVSLHRGAGAKPPDNDRNLPNAEVLAAACADAPGRVRFAPLPEETVADVGVRPRQLVQPPPPYEEWLPGRHPG